MKNLGVYQPEYNLMINIFVNMLHQLEVFTDEFWLSVDERARREVGGTSDYIKKTPLRAETRKTQAVQEFARGTPAPQAARSNGISRDSLYRALRQKTSSVR